MVKSNPKKSNTSRSEEAKLIMNNLMTNEQFRFKFFFPMKNDGQAYSIAPIMNYVIKCVKRSYDYTISTTDFGLIMYEKFWGNGTWHVLSTFKGDNSFWTWLFTVTFRTITSYLEEEGVIKVEREPTGSNTSLLLYQYLPDERLYIINEVLPEGDMHNMLVDIYVNEKNDAEMMSQLDMDGKQYKKVRQRAETYFRRRLIETCTGYEKYVLTMKSPRMVTMSIDELCQLSDSYTLSASTSPFSDVFGVNLTNTQVRQKADQFVLKFITRNLQWKKKDCYVFMQRRAGIPAKDVAEKLGCRPDWVDTRNSRLKREFYQAFKAWWGRNA